MKQHITKTKTEARKLYKDGYSTYQVGKMLNIGNATVYRWCKDIIRTKKEALKGDKHPLWGGGVFKLGKYKGMRVNGKVKRVHRHVMEQYLGRELHPWEVVHHKDRNKENNDISNLELTDWGHHTSRHNMEKNNKVVKEKVGFWFGVRVWLANLLVRLANRIRPKHVTQLMQSIEDSLIYGDGVTRVDPKTFFRS